MTNDDSLFPMPGRPGRPKSSPLSRAEQNREAQARRRALLREEGLSSHTFLLREDTAEKLRAIGAKEGCDLSDAVALAAAKYNDKSAEIRGIPGALVDELEAMFPEENLPEALVAAAAKWVAEVKRKRASSRRSRRK